MSDQRKRDEYTKDRFDWLDQVAADSDLPASAFKVAYAIATSLWRQKGTVTLMTPEITGTDQVREAWIGTREIADKIAMSRFTVMKMVDRLQERGHLEFDPGSRGRGHSHHYRLVKKGAPANILKTAKGAHSSQLDGAQAKRRSKQKGAPANLLDGEKVRPRT
jgi:biotin operon repressor